MAMIILVLLFALMLMASLPSLRKPRSMPHIDEVITRETPRRGWGVLPWLLAIVVVIFALRLFLG